MPDINPVTIDQMLLKKISRNMGNEHDDIDISEINPLTIEQIFLKEIAGSSAGEASDIEDLKDKTEALSDTMAANGAHNLLPIKLSYVKAKNTNGVWSNNIYTRSGVDITFEAENDYVNSISMSGTATAEFNLILNDFADASKYSGNILSGTPNGQNGVSINLNTTHAPYINYASDSGSEAIIGAVPTNTSCSIFINIQNGKNTNGLVFKPMIRFASDQNSSYAPYAMSNIELTNNKADKSDIVLKGEEGSSVDAAILSALQKAKSLVIITATADMSGVPVGISLIIPKMAVASNAIYFQNGDSYNGETYLHLQTHLSNSICDSTAFYINNNLMSNAIYTTEYL